MLTHAHRSELLTVKELAAEWRQHPATIYKKIAGGEIPAVRLGDGQSALRIPRAELERMMPTSGGGSFGGSEPAMGRGSFVDDSAERDGTSSRREAVEPARLAGER